VFVFVDVFLFFLYHVPSNVNTQQFMSFQFLHFVQIIAFNVRHIFSNDDVYATLLIQKKFCAVDILN